ncbi:MAG TPA: F0F1 ATP synthase subunit A [Thermoanaerobaculia bacterium]|nr:F0F1 ATP synthase subunit A [Thermoanaerobaculia bacterium]
MMAAANPLEHIVQHPLVTYPLDLGKVKPALGFLTPRHEITLLSNHIAMLMLTGLMLMLLVPVMVRRRRALEGGPAADEIGALVPAGPANAVEAICLYLRSQVAEPTLHEHTDRFIKFLWTLFFFVLINNLMGLVPLASVTPLAGLHIGGTATGNIWVTGTLAVMTFFLMIWNGVRLAGWQFFAHFCPGPLWLAPLLVPIEILGLFAKAFALAIRLFANMLAGHMMLAVLLGFILGAGTAMGAGIGLAVAVPVIAGSVAVTFIEILVAVIQAFIFTFLTSLFIGQSVVVHGEEAHAH